MEKITVTLTVTAGGSVAEQFTQSIDTSGNCFAAAYTLTNKVRWAAHAWVNSQGSKPIAALPDIVAGSATIVVELPGHGLQDAIRGEGRDGRQVLLGLIDVAADNATAKIGAFAKEIERRAVSAAYNPPA